MELPASEPAAADIATIAANLSAATGGAAPHHALQLMRDLADAAGPGAGGSGDAGADREAGEARVVAAIEAALALAPRDPLEGMLIAQMAAVNAAAMRCLGRAAECADHPKIETLYLREASRLLHLFVRQAEALDRRARRFGPPKEDAAETAGASGGWGERGCGPGRQGSPRKTPQRHLRAPARSGARRWGPEDREGFRGRGPAFAKPASAGGGRSEGAGRSGIRRGPDP